MLTDLEPLLVTLFAEADRLKKVLKSCEKVRVAVSNQADDIRDRHKRTAAALEILTDRQEHGVSLEMRAEFARRFKKTMDQQQLDGTAIENLTVDVRNAVRNISKAGIFLKHELKQDLGV